jgi:hypothetical protein
MSNPKLKNNQRHYLINSPIYLIDILKKTIGRPRNMKIRPVFLWGMECNKVDGMRKVAKDASRIRHDCVTFYCGLGDF